MPVTRGGLAHPLLEPQLLRLALLLLVMLPPRFLWFFGGIGSWQTTDLGGCRTLGPELGVCGSGS